MKEEKTVKENKSQNGQQPVVMQSLLPTIANGLLEQRKILIEKMIRRTELSLEKSQVLLDETIRIDVLIEKISKGNNVA